MATGNDSFVRLIRDMANKPQDDTDPNDIMLQRFFAPVDYLSLVETSWVRVSVPPAASENSTTAEAVEVTRWEQSPKWAGAGVPVTFRWNQGGKYR